MIRTLELKLRLRFKAKITFLNRLKSQKEIEQRRIKEYIMISIIVAVASNGVIGGDNKLLWHISDDLKRFKAITSGHGIIMGRKTFESLGRALPNRRNVVISRNGDYIACGAEVVGSLEEAVRLFDAAQETFIIGGGEIYRQAIEIANKIYITEVNKPYEGDTHFPNIDKNVWTEILREACEGYSFVEYLRK